MLIFGIIQIVTSQIPNFHNMAWLSVVAALMSFCYSFIGLGLGFSKVIGKALTVIFLILFLVISSRFPKIYQRISCILILVLIMEQAFSCLISPLMLDLQIIGVSREALWEYQQRVLLRRFG